VEGLLKTAEMLALKGDTQGQRDQIVGELMRVHTRFQARVAEYNTLLNMAVRFFQDLAKVTETERVYSPNKIIHRIQQKTMQSNCSGRLPDR